MRVHAAAVHAAAVAVLLVAQRCGQVAAVRRGAKLRDIRNKIKGGRSQHMQRAASPVDKDANKGARMDFALSNNVKVSPTGKFKSAVARLDVEQLTLPPFQSDSCACHGQRFLFNPEFGDCFNPWLETVVGTCNHMCTCYPDIVDRIRYDWSTRRCVFIDTGANATALNASTSASVRSNKTAAAASGWEFIKRIVDINGTSSRPWQMLHVEGVHACDAMNVTAVDSSNKMNIWYNTTVFPTDEEVYVRRNGTGWDSGTGWKDAAPLECWIKQKIAASLAICTVTGNTCLDDPYWEDSDGDGCDFYAAFPRPDLACNTPGYTHALVYCPVSCGTCASQGFGKSTATVSGASYIHARYFHEHRRRRSRCILVNNIGALGTGHGKRIRGNQVSETAIIEDAMGESGIIPGSANLNLCARNCFRYRDGQGGHLCNAFAIFNNTQGDQHKLGQYCIYSSVCTDPDLLTHKIPEVDFNSSTSNVTYDVGDAAWDTYIIKTSASPCDPTPASPLTVDSCGVCGGANTSCGASLELMPASKLISGVDTRIGTEKWLPESVEPDELNNDQRNCSLNPYSTYCVDQKRVVVPYAKVPESTKQYSTAHAFIRITGAKGISESLLGFGSHTGGNIAPFQMFKPTADQIGNVEMVELFVLGEENWLSLHHDNRISGINLSLTVDWQLHQWEFRTPDNFLDSHVASFSTDNTSTIANVQTMVYRWQTVQHGVREIPSSIYACFQDCSYRPAVKKVSWPPERYYPDGTQVELAQKITVLQRDGLWPGLQKGCNRVCRQDYEFNVTGLTM